ncbi:uncharacterized protein BT62DRAFT_897963 [Guyanagaster necrorhizus]|uniref:Thioesterase domain-containing protein n=1 Tax=Guyanagaster necrorhizus TaxID=856835 RepID=A0A9P8ARL8_9AGAR|nr:uncharacterized protein BT62DRAFT_897963 [Guyanagaster necrorhizus MCA 3950]KAG7445324.1 hypothetical protein BT62DRAFT_897963 [Guyanagaster necrorhizus MCA 3950]
MAQRLVQLIYIHGFRGDDTTFQSFPCDLQGYLAARIPPELNIHIRSSLYPTYKSVKPISHATKNFLEWLTTQPPGPVILLGHSMGGLLAAEAATHISNNPDGYRPHRIVGMVAFDTPYLGMHPHVVITGIASLFTDDSKDKKTERQMNEHPDVQIVDSNVTDEWETFRKNIGGMSLSPYINQSLHSSTGCIGRTSSSSLLLFPSHSSSSPPSRSPSPSLIDQTMNFLNSHADDPLVRWARKHSDEPFTASKRWLVEHFQFGSCMFDPAGLKARYTALVKWNGGLWVNYWTQTVPRVQEDAHVHEADNDVALLQTGMAETLSITSSSSSSSLPSLGPWTTSETKTKTKTKVAKKDSGKHLKKQRDKEAKKGKIGRHFIVLPTGLGRILGGGEKWEKVLIAGVRDEVGAHCGLFIRGQNMDYDGLVDRVSRKILGWCYTL